MIEKPTIISVSGTGPELTPEQRSLAARNIAACIAYKAGLGPKMPPLHAGIISRARPMSHKPPPPQKDYTPQTLRVPVRMTSSGPPPTPLLPV